MNVIPDILESFGNFGFTVIISILAIVLGLIGCAIIVGVLGCLAYGAWRFYHRLPQSQNGNSK